MNAGKVWCGISLLALMTAFALPARAESEAQKKQEAKERHETAKRFYDLGKYGEAIAEYEAAYLLIPDPNVLYNIGQAYRLWDKPEEAIRSYKSYLRQRPDAPNRADVEKRIAELERSGDDRHAPATEPPAATPTPEGGPLMVPTPAPSAPPVAFPGPESPPPPVAAVVVQPKPADKPAGPSWLDRNSRAGMYVMFSAGGACLVTSMVTGILANKKAKQLADDSKQPSHPVFDPSLQSSGKTLNTVAIVTGVTGLALGGAGLYLLFRSRHVAEAAEADAAKPLALFPLAGPGLAGVGASMTF